MRRTTYTDEFNWEDRYRGFHDLDPLVEFLTASTKTARKRPSRTTHPHREAGAVSTIQYQGEAKAYGAPKKRRTAQEPTYSRFVSVIQSVLGYQSLILLQSEHPRSEHWSSLLCLHVNWSLTTLTLRPSNLQGGDYMSPLCLQTFPAEKRNLARFISIWRRRFRTGRAIASISRVLRVLEKQLLSVKSSVS